MRIVCRSRPCAECPWSTNTQPGQFPWHRYEALRDTTGEPGAEAGLFGLNATSAERIDGLFRTPLFACHKSREPDTMPCAGWLAAVGYENMTVRVMVARGLIPGDRLRPGADWPPLFESYEDMMNAQAGDDGRVQRIDDAIDAWHTSGPEETRELHEYLGWTWDEYKRWTEQGISPPAREGAL